MVELGKPCISFGKPFKERFDQMGKLIPEKPAPHYPNVLATNFNPIEAIQVYRQLLGSENGIRSFHSQVQKLREPERDWGPRVLDMMPGRSSIGATVGSMRYSTNPLTAVREAPELPPPVFYDGSGASNASERSAAASRSRRSSGGGGFSASDGRSGRTSARSRSLPSLGHADATRLPASLGAVGAASAISGGAGDGGRYGSRAEDLDKLIFNKLKGRRTFALC
eukprot:TRINITY_DN63818_c0_g1_i1.p1 TRINITY_DN63818_c0_g1~~TRINITY_DN63818_c0_g1_i1.p1  ORF type:complete len:239 (+),score=37.63 TRINITY_DN63818_c0_g1_i1:48-719(+)